MADLREAWEEVSPDCQLDRDVSQIRDTFW
jgi:hypothetical protein